MAELTKKLYIKKGDTQQTAKLYSTTAEAGTVYAHLIVDGVQAYLPLGEPNDGMATIGRIKETSGHVYAILTSGKPPYHKDSYTTPGTYTWTCPTGVTTVKVTVAGGGAGGCTLFHIVKYPGGSGALITDTVSVVPNSSYSVVVGAGSDGVVSGNRPKYPENGGTSSALGIQAQGGKAYQGDNSPAQSYGDGGAGGDDGEHAGSHGWVYIEYGGDI